MRCALYFQFDLHDEFLIRKIEVVFISPGASQDMRPNAVKIEVRRGQGQGQEEEWTAWRYYSSDCSQYFPDVTEQVLANGQDATSVVCMQKYYQGYSPSGTDTGHAGTDTGQAPYQVLPIFT